MRTFRFNGRVAEPLRRSRRHCGRKLYCLDRSDKAVAAAGKRLDIARGFGGIAEHFAKPRDGVVKAMVEIDEGVGGPNLVAKLLAGHDIAGAV